MKKSMRLTKMASALLFLVVMAFAIIAPHRVQAADAPAAPTIGMAVNLKDGIEIGWDEIEGADGYYLYRSVNGGSFKKIATIDTGDTVWYLDSNVENNSKYTYRMKAYIGQTNSAYSAKKTTYRVGSTTVTVQNQTKGIKVTWEKVPGAAGYKVYRKEPGEEYKLLTTKVGEDSLSFVNTSTQIGKIYYYMVKPYIKPVSVNYYNHEDNSVVVARLTKIKNVSAELLSNRKIKVSWTPTPGVEGYIISQKNNTTGKATNFIISYKNTDEYLELQNALAVLEEANANMALIMAEHEESARQLTEAQEEYNVLLTQQAELTEEAEEAYATYEQKLAEADVIIEEANTYYDEVCDPIPIEDEEAFDAAYEQYLEMMYAAHDIQVEAYAAYDTYIAKSNEAQGMYGPIFQAEVVLSNAQGQYQYEIDEDIPTGEALVAEAQANVNAAQAAYDAFMESQSGAILTKTVNPTSTGEFSYTVRSYVESYKSEFSNKAYVTKP